MRELRRDLHIVGEIEGRGMLKIGEVSKRSGVGIEALRFYENAGLLNKAARTPAGYRLYDEEVIERLAFVKRAQSLGLSLEEIKRVIERAASGIDPCDEVRELVRRRLRELDLRLREMRRYRRELKSTLDGWNKLGQVEGKVCGLIEASQMENSARRRTEGLKHK